MTPPAIITATARIPARAWHGRPARITARAATAAALSALAALIIPGTPAATAIQAAAALWWLTTSRPELAPPAPRTPPPAPATPRRKGNDT